MPKVRKRADDWMFLNIPSGSSGKAFTYMGIGYTGIDENPNPQTTDKRYVCDKSASTAINGYKFEASFTAEQIKSIATLEYIRSIARDEKTGEDAETEYLTVRIDEPVSGQNNTFKAVKRKVSIAVTGYPDNDGELGLEGTFYGVGDPIYGTATVTTTDGGAATATFTADSDSNNEQEDN